MDKLFRLKKIISNENNRTILNNTLGAFVVRGGALLISLFTLPAYIRYFDNQQILGLWFTILSVLIWVLTFDLGIGNGLRNHLVHALVNKDHLLAKKYISSAYIVIGILVLFISCFSTVIFRFINWNAVFNISTSIVSKETLNITVCIVFGGIMLQFLLKLITSILYAMQKSALTNLLSLLNSIIILGYVLLAKSSDISTNLISLAIVNVLAVNIPLLLTTIIVFSTKLKDSKPNINYFGKKYAREVMKLGVTFFWVQIMYMILTTTNEFLITWLTGSKMVVEYQIYNKLFTLIGTIFTLALTPIWSAVTKALSEKNYEWINKLYRTLNLMALLAVICEFGMIPFLQFGINLWLGDNAIQVNYLYATVFALSGSIFIWNGVLSSIANGIGELKTQSVYFTIGAIIKIPIAWTLVMIFDSWIGIVVADIIAMSLYCIIQPIWLKKYLDKKELGDENYV
ncbi:polysaccharide biosynthesis C-terminal domain-containing protein [Bacillus sp. sid0103]|uniref:lipopolysaccharide biosynthesis protein n=1 Tax=Bacillus sp. sid0103 TaxID=2856337 RepID=UPI001C488413|nr:polysaccharide biosynthesis C-terminal domain-containing protein [Bacillus sp. sid0103]MBV7508973.1 polysaccharide biosynthesis C-terminal domain-containing protein [Bacillus sp. sid0103]